MAQFVHTYVAELLKRQRIASNLLGADVMGTGRELYAINATLLVLVGVLMKALNDKGVVSDAEWLARLDTALDQSQAAPWPAWILEQRDPNQP